LRAVSFLCEFTEALTRETAGSSWSNEDGHAEHAPSPQELYTQLSEAVAALAAGQRPGWALLRYALTAMVNGGWMPDLDRCSSCHTKLPVGATPVRLSFAGVLCQQCAAADAPLYENPKRPGPASARCVWLTPEVLNALAFVQRTGHSVNLSVAGAKSLARAMMLLIHSALEHDLRTLNGAANAIVRLSRKARRRQTG
jgi:recombinational DNA repair protein (RecF pathway)